MKSTVYRTVGAFLVATLLVLGYRSAPMLVPAGGEAMAMAAYVNADALAEFLLQGEARDE